MKEVYKYIRKLEAALEELVDAGYESWGERVCVKAGRKVLESRPDRYDVLCEAVACERECRDMRLKTYRFKKAKSFHNAVHSLYVIQSAARAEVDKLLTSR